MIRGFTAGNFDVIHPGYIKLFKECFKNCDHFTILLHSDPSIERPDKLKPVLTLEERIEILESIKYISDIKTYKYESELYELIKQGNFNIRFLGEDYKNRDFTGKDLNVKIQYLSRDHGWSTTKFKKLISKTI